MKFVKTKYNDYIYIQIYINKEEMEKKETREKINSMKSKNSKIAIFVNGNNNYLESLEKIILLKAKEDNIL
ncbi:MAG: hypothetical protein Q4G09_05525 [Clostridia bacterium]|nr:hypothetical protein [Clostridia bacterium]